MRGPGLLFLACLGGWPAMVAAAPPYAAPPKAAKVPAFTATVTGGPRAVIRPAPGRAKRLNPGKPPTAAQRRAALRARIHALEAEIADLEKRVASAPTPAARAALQMRLDARRQELVANRQADAALGRRAGRR